MSRRWLTGLGVLALCFLAATARAQQPAPAPAAPPAAPPPTDTPWPQSPTPAAPPVAAPPADAAPVVPEAALAPPPPASYVTAPASPAASRAPARASIARRWWFWTGLGAAAVGLVVAAIALSPRDPYMGNASPGIVSPF